MSSFKLSDYQKIRHLFELGHLSTEKAHPKTKQLSSLCLEKPGDALELLSTVDVELKNLFAIYQKHSTQLVEKIQKTWKRGGRVFLCGCGATGRLVISLETLLRKKGEKNTTAFMAGGDLALIESIERFEDFPHFAHRQLEELEFSSNDLFIGVTEGGETPFVIGATEKASEISKNVFFLYCNPDSELIKIERSKKVLKNKKIKKINLSVGPMALMGSTRMQAATMQMGFLMQVFKKSLGQDLKLQKIFDLYESFDWKSLITFMYLELQNLRKKKKTIYKSDSDLALCLLTDTTERSPTFSLPPFENFYSDHKTFAPYSLEIINAENPANAWEMILERAPRTLEWIDMREKTGKEKILGYGLYETNTAGFTIKKNNSKISLFFSQTCFEIDLDTLDLMEMHLFLKMLLNNYSTVLMGRYGRFKGNVMSWVRPSNYKLIDRALRSASERLKDEGYVVTTQELAYKCWDKVENVNANKSLVESLAQVYKERIKV